MAATPTPTTAPIRSRSPWPTTTCRRNFASGVAGVDFVEKTFIVTVANVTPTLTGTNNIQVNEGQAITLSGLGVGLEDPGFDNPLNPTTPTLGDPFTESFRGYTINWGDGTAADDLSVVGRISDLDQRFDDGVTTKASTSCSPAWPTSTPITASTRSRSASRTTTWRQLRQAALFADNAGAGSDYVDLTFQIKSKRVPHADFPQRQCPRPIRRSRNSTFSLTNLATIRDPGLLRQPAQLPSGSTDDLPLLARLGRRRRADRFRRHWRCDDRPDRRCRTPQAGPRSMVVTTTRTTASTPSRSGIADDDMSAGDFATGVNGQKDVRLRRE